MVWSKWSDTIATDPRVMALADPGDARLQHEALGFFLRLVSQSAAHLTDYAVDTPTCTMLAGQRATPLLQHLQRAGLVTPRGRGRSRTWVILDDPELVHLRRKAEIAWEKQRREDHRSPELTVPVRQRDGDGCRYCGQVVSWRARRGARAGTYDHRAPGAPATVETYVVACRSCNATRGDDVQADQRLPLLPQPAQPYYSADTTDFLSRHGVQVEVSDPPAPQPAGPPTSTTHRGDKSTTTQVERQSSRTPSKPERAAQARDLAPGSPTPATEQPETATAPRGLGEPNDRAQRPAPAPGHPPTGPTEHALVAASPEPPGPEEPNDRAQRPAPAPGSETSGRGTPIPGPGRSGQVDGVTPGTGRVGPGRQPPAQPTPDHLIEHTPAPRRGRRGRR